MGNRKDKKKQKAPETMAEQLGSLWNNAAESGYLGEQAKSAAEARKGKYKRGGFTSKKYGGM